MMLKSMSTRGMGLNMSKFYRIHVPCEMMNGTQFVIATESNFGTWRDLLGPDILSLHQLARRVKDYCDAGGIEMPGEKELGFALLRLVQEGLVGMTGGKQGPLIKFKRLHEDAVLPKYAKSGDAGADVHSVETVRIFSGSTRAVALGFAIEIEPGWEIQVRPRSGLAAKKGITVLNSPGTIDSGYRGECKVIIHNTADIPFDIAAGDRIAQFVVKRAPQAYFEEVDELSDSDRGTGGLGSTGK